MAESVSNKRRIVSIVLAWLIFIGIDFFCHASLLSSNWEKDLPALKSLNELALLIPAGYLSFLLLTLLIGFVFFKVFPTKPAYHQVILFGFVFAILFALSNFLGLYSYINLPLKELALFNLVYFVEILTVTLSIYHFTFNINLKKSILYGILIFLGLVIIGIVIQNVIQNF